MAALMMRDPREGNRRQKQALQQLLQQLAQRRQALAGKSGYGRVARAAVRAGRGPAFTNRPFGGTSFLSDLRAGPGQGKGQASAVGLQRVASAGRPVALPMPGQGPGQGNPNSAVNAYGDPVGDLGFDPVSPGDPGGSYTGPGSGLGLVELPRVGQSPIAQNGPGGQILIGGMIPLGGGSYMDPNTLVIHGAGPGNARVGR